MFLETGEQLRAARAAVRMQQEELARAAGVSTNAIRRLEQFDGRLGARLDTVRRLQRALEQRGVVFLSGDEPGLRIKLDREPPA